MTDLQKTVSAIEALYGRAAEGPWIADPDDRPGMHYNYHILQGGNPHLAVCFMAHDNGGKYAEHNALLITALVNSWPLLREAARDAERYRKLKAAITVPHAMQTFIAHMNWHPDTFKMGIDEAIDAALSAGKEGK